MDTKENLTKQDVIWCESDNFDATKTVYHAYYGRLRKRLYTGELYSGNSALCNKNKGMSNENEEFIPIYEVENSGLKEDKVCKSCLLIFKKLP
jgi:hypothetical protein